MSDTAKDQDELTEEEAAAKRDEVLKRMLNTPPKPRSGPVNGVKNEKD